MSQPGSQSVYRQYTDPPSRPANDAMPIYTATYSGVNVYEMEINGVSLMRRQKDGWLNATQILKVAGVEKGRRTKILEKEIQTGEHEKVQGGYGKYQGTWIPFERGLQVCEQYGVKDAVAKLLNHNRNTGDGGAGDVDTPTKEQAMAAQRKRMYAASSQENRPSGSGTFFSRVSSTAQTALSAISKARFDSSPAPRNRNGPTRAPSFNRQSSMSQEFNDFPNNSQQSFVSDYAPNGGSAYGSQDTQPLNGDGLEQPPRKRQRVLTPANSFGGLTPTYPPLDAYNAFPGSPTEPNESFIYSQHGVNADPDRPYGPIPLRPLPYERSEDGQAKRSMLMGLFINNNTPSEEQCKVLQEMTPQELDVPLDETSSTALHWAAALSRIPLLKVLMEAGSSPYRVNADGRTALMRVCTVTNSWEQQSFPEILDLLGPMLHFLDGKNRSVLHHIAITSAILGRGTASKYYLECLLEWVVRQGSAPSRDALPNNNHGVPRMSIGRFMSEIVNAQDDMGDTALNIAARIGHRSIISQLLEVGADPRIANNAGLKPLDFAIGVEAEHMVNGENGTNGNDSSQPAAQKSKETGEDIVNFCTHLLGDTSATFMNEVKRKQESIDSLHASIRSVSQQLVEARRNLEATQEKVKAQALTRQKVVNLQAACEEEERQLDKLEKRYGRLDVRQTNEEEIMLRNVLEAHAKEEKELDGQALGATLPSTKVLHARINSLQKRTIETGHKVNQLQACSKERELKYRRLVSLCTKVPDEQVETLLETLTKAVESEKPELEMTRIQRFLGGVEALGQ